MSTTHTSNALSCSFANLLDNLHASLLARDFTISEYGLSDNGYRSYDFSMGNFVISLALNFHTSSIVHFPHSSTVDLSHFKDIFNFDFFSSILNAAANVTNSVLYEVPFSVGNRVVSSSKYSDGKSGLVWRVTDRAVHVMFDDNSFEKFHFTAEHHLQTKLECLQRLV